MLEGGMLEHTDRLLLSAPTLFQSESQCIGTKSQDLKCERHHLLQSPFSSRKTKF